MHGEEGGRAGEPGNSIKYNRPSKNDLAIQVLVTFKQHDIRLKKSTSKHSNDTALISNPPRLLKSCPILGHLLNLLKLHLSHLLKKTMRDYYSIHSVAGQTK